MVEEPQKTTNRKSRATLGVLQQPFYRQKEERDEKAMEEAEAQEDAGNAIWTNGSRTELVM